MEGYCDPYKNETLEVFNLKLQKKTHCIEAADWYKLNYTNEAWQRANNSWEQKRLWQTLGRGLQRQTTGRLRNKEKQSLPSTGAIQPRIKYIEIRQISDTVNKIDNPISHQKRNQRQKIIQSSERTSELHTQWQSRQVRLVISAGEEILERWWIKSLHRWSEYVLLTKGMMMATPTPKSISWVLLWYSNSLGYGIVTLLHKICLVNSLKSNLSQIKIKSR